MSSIQKISLTLLGLLALIVVSISIMYMYMIFGTSRQATIESNCILKESNECPYYENSTPAWVNQQNTATLTPLSASILSTPQPISTAFTNIPTSTFSANLLISPIAEQTITPTTEVSISGSENNPSAEEWRGFPIVPELSLNAQRILITAAENSYLDLHTFVKVGDCHMESGIFLSGFVKGSYRVPAGLEETTQWFSESMVSDNITAVSGYGINTVLDTAYALPKGNDQCSVNETPLDCELRTKHPSIVLIAMGTNWIPHGEKSFEKHLRTVVLRVLETGALPILATKADNLEGDWKINYAITQVSIDYDIPLVNVWGAMQDLPRKGLRPDGFHLTGDGWLRNSSTWLNTLEKVYKIVSQ